MKLDDILKILKDNLNEINNYGVIKLGVFGSFVKNTFSHDSDIDIVVQFKKGSKTFDNFMDLKFYLEKILNKKVDLVILEAIKPDLKDEILKDVEYAA
ncbi:MAG: nucleotidyltransferase family protein [Pseudomonadota bacterium]